MAKAAFWTLTDPESRKRGEMCIRDRIYIMIADAQALTDNAEHPEKVRQNIMEVALD